MTKYMASGFSLKVSEIFLDLTNETKPIAAASLGQVSMQTYTFCDHHFKKLASFTLNNIFR
jgi:hypothetical protein